MAEQNVTVTGDTEKRKPEVLDVGAHKVLVYPDDMNVKAVKDFEDQYLEKPRFRAGEIQTYDLSSFIELTERNKSADTIILAKQPKIEGKAVGFSMTSILDYHPEGDDVKSTGGSHHKVTYRASIHERIAKWLAKDDEYFTQAEFAAFIEDQIGDLTALEGWTPPFGKALATPAEMFTLARGLEVRVNQTIGNATRLQDGTVSLQFVTTNSKQDGSELIVPEWFGLRLPIFVGTEPMILPMRLRYLAKDGGIYFKFLFFGFEEILEQAVKATINKVRAELNDLQVFEGVI